MLRYVSLAALGYGRHPSCFDLSSRSRHKNIFISPTRATLGWESAGTCFCSRKVAFPEQKQVAPCTPGHVLPELVR
eukprot:762638-Prorocentrum_minimum.AAC.3